MWDIVSACSLTLTVYVDVDVVCGPSLIITRLACVHSSLIATQPRLHRQHTAVNTKPLAERQLRRSSVPAVGDVRRVCKCRHV